MPEVTENGITFFKSELESVTTTISGSDVDTILDVTYPDTDLTLSFDKTKINDPDVDFNTETSVFQYFDDDYLENNPSTTSPIISYVGQYFSDTVSGQNTFEIEDEAPSGTGTRFSSTSFSFDNTNVKFDRVFT